MKVKLYLLFFIAFTLFANSLFSQVQTLSRIGHTPGGAGFHVNWDGASQKLVVGCGTSIWLYDMSDPSNPVILAKRPLLGIINETDFYGDVLFVAATHDGIYALDLQSENLDVLARYVPTGPGEHGAYDMRRVNDTLYIPESSKTLILKYNGSDEFIEIGNFGALFNVPKCIGIKGDRIAVGISSGLFTSGKISIYSKSNPISAIATWESNLINGVCDIRFSDLQDDIIYVCGGSSDAGFNSYFVTLQLSGSDIIPLDTIHITGIPFLMAANFQNIDSRNDTLYVATGCAEDVTMGLPFSYIPVLDATTLPGGEMEMISYVNAGFWHFDVALMDGTPYMATASEWLGVVINDVSESEPFDTLKTIPTGGWTENCKIRGDTLWVAHEGWGLAAYKVDSLLFDNGYMTDPFLLHLFNLNGPEHFFTGDFEFIDDTLMVLSSGDVFNLKPWFEGGEAERLHHLNVGTCVELNKIKTSDGIRLLVSTDALGFNPKEISIFNPFVQINENLKTIEVFNNPRSVHVANDTLFYAANPDTTLTNIYLYAAIIENDDFVVLDSILASTLFEVNSISFENSIVAIGIGNKVTWYSWFNEEFSEIDSYYNVTLNAQDIELKNNLIYVADRWLGLQIIDISESEPELVATFTGTGGWENLGGSMHLDVGNDGKIYLSDFHAGVMIIEPYDLTLINQTEHVFNSSSIFHLYPNPVKDEFSFEFANGFDIDGIKYRVTDITGKVIISESPLASCNQIISIKNWPKGLYFISLIGKNKIIETTRLIVQ